MNSRFDILIVDDDLKSIQAGINLLKQNENYNIEFATSGLQALEKVNQNNFDLVLLDICMPVMDGYEVCRKLKENSKTENIPIIFLITNYEIDNKLKIFELGAKDYIIKPFNSLELNARVKTHLKLNYYHKSEIDKLQQLINCHQIIEKFRFFVKGFSHECNNFLTLIPLTLHTIKYKFQKQNLDFSAYEKYYNTINASVDNISNLLNKLRDFSLHGKICSDVVDLKEVINTLNNVYAQYFIKEIDLNVKFNTKFLLVEANKLHLEQVLISLLLNAKNAIEAKTESDEKGNILIEISQCEAPYKNSTVFLYICISIKDNGVGMSEDVMKKNFDTNFPNFNEEDDFKLRLAVCQSIIQSHGGNIEVSSKEGKGTEYKVYLKLPENLN